MKNKEPKYKLSVIKDITTLTELSKYDTLIRNHAKEFIRCKETADDLVNDMYLSLNKAMLKGKNIDGGYIHITLQNLYKNHLKFKIGRFDFGDSINEAKIPEFEDNFEETYQDKLYQESLYEELEVRIENLTWYEKKILEFEDVISLSELARQSGITYRSLCYSRDKMRDKLGVIKKHHADSKNNPLNNNDND